MPTSSDHETDFFEDDSSPIVDCDVLEAAKENIQPLASGRRVTALSAILSTPHAQRESRLASARNRHRINVEIALEDEDDDPLEAYCRFVYWTVENYPQGHSAESGLLELLEEATRVLRNGRGGKWKDDLRYLKLWVLYASYVEKPAVVFKFCLVNEIGTSHALLYEEFAIALERAGRKTEADETYLLGIARRASTLERLESKHREFQKRMMSATSLPDPAPAEPSGTGFSTTSNRRSVLGESSTTSSRTRASTRTSSSRVASQQQSQEDIFSAPSAPRPNGRIPIFVDPSGTESQDVAPAPWGELGSRKSRVKENVMEATKIAGTTIRQSGRSHRATSSSSGAPRMAVYRDPEPGTEAGEEAESMPPPPVIAPKAVRKDRPASKSSMMIFRDDEADGMAASAAPLSKKTRAPSSSKSSIPIFRDDGDEDMPPPSASGMKKGRAASSSKSSITIFREDEVDAQSSLPPVPSTPKFTPFRDEEPTTPSTSHRDSQVPGTVMKDKGVVGSGAGTRGGLTMSSEAEALRKDPLKNYDEDERLLALELA